jgi:hypothetical protein
VDWTRCSALWNQCLAIWATSSVWKIFVSKCSYFHLFLCNKSVMLWERVHPTLLH